LKILWIGGLLSLLMIAVYARLSGSPGGAWATPADKHALPFVAAPRLLPAKPVGDPAAALTPADYVYLHETR